MAQQALLANDDSIVHVVDSDHRTRAAIASEVAKCQGHAEIYEDMGELLGAAPETGVLLINCALATATELLTDLGAAGLFLPLMLFGHNPKPSQIVQAVHEGAANFLAWPFSGEELLSSCAYCQAFLVEKGDAIARQHRARALVDGLSDREKQILALLLEGYSNKVMANSLGLSLRTIEDYRLNTIRKLGVGHTSGAIRVGLEAGLQDLAPHVLGQTGPSSVAPPR